MDRNFLGEQIFLEHMQAEIVTVTNSEITCKGADNEDGGSNIDYVIISVCLLGGVKSCLADFKVPFAPHFGTLKSARQLLTPPSKQTEIIT